MTAKTTVLVCDDHELFREGLKAILRPEDAISVVFEQLAEDRLAFAVERDSVRIADGMLVVRLGT